MDTNQKLGIKVFYYYLSKKISMGVVLLVVSFIFSSLKITLISKLSAILSLKGAISFVNTVGSGLFLLSFFLIALSLIISFLDYISCDFTLGENAFSIRRGILNKKEVSIPYRQIQDISIDQTFGNKMMGVSKLVILTAGHDDNVKEGEAEGVFVVIDAKIALNIKEIILQKINFK